ncbi:hypothetical protein [Acidiphilium sp.]|nr:hypothetical protein [Acidiphilium sp.]
MAGLLAGKLRHLADAKWTNFKKIHQIQMVFNKSTAARMGVDSRRAGA